MRCRFPSLLGFILTAFTLEAAPDRRPNIVLLFADDLGRYASAYADPASPSANDLISTPTFDRIAREGVLATNAFVSCPSCSPSRASLLSGRHFFRNGSHAQLHTPWHGDPSEDPWNGVRGFALILQDAGYHIGWSHKMHIAEDRMGGKQRNYRRAGRKVNRFSQFVSKAPDPEKAKKEIYQECRKNFQDFLADRKPDQPFYYSFHPTNPHRSWTRGSGRKLWGLDPEALKGKLPWFLPDVPIVREDFADYLGEGMAFDRCCQVILDELEKRGELDKTLIVISGDHGAPGFPRGKTNLYDFGSRVLFAARWPGHIHAGQTVHRPISLIDLAPTFLDAAGLAPEGGTNGQTLLPALKKRDHEKLRGWALIGREAHVDTARPLNLPYPSRALRTEDFLYIVNFMSQRLPQGNALALDQENPPSWDQIDTQTRLTFADVDAGPTRTWILKNRERKGPTMPLIWNAGFGLRPSTELYDLRTDPSQRINVADEDQYAPIKADLHAQLMNELRANHDPRLHGNQFDYPPYTAKGLSKK